MDQLPIELHQLLSKHLNIVQYHSFRFSFKNTLPLKPKLSFFAFNESANYLDITCIGSMELDDDSINDTSFMYLYNSDFFQEFQRVLHYRSISLELKFSILGNWIDHFKMLNEPIVAKLISVLMKNAGTVNRLDFDSILKRAVLWKFNNILEDLIMNNLGDPSTSMNFPLVMSISPLNMVATRLLLSDSRVDPSCDDNFPLRSACKTGNIHLAKLLINHPKFNPNLAIDTCFTVAIAAGHLEIVEALVDANIVDLRNNVNLGLNIAIAAGHIELVRYFMESESQIDLDHVLMVAENHRRNGIVKYFKGLKRKDMLGSVLRFIKIIVSVVVLIGFILLYIRKYHKRTKDPIVSFLVLPPDFPDGRNSLIEEPLPVYTENTNQNHTDCVYPKEPEPEEEYVILEIRPGIDSDQFNKFNRSDSTLASRLKDSGASNTVAVQTDAISTKENQEATDIEIVTADESKNTTESAPLLGSNDQSTEKNTNIDSVNLIVSPVDQQDTILEPADVDDDLKAGTKESAELLEPSALLAKNDGSASVVATTKLEVETLTASIESPATTPQSVSNSCDVTETVQTAELESKTNLEIIALNEDALFSEENGTNVREHAGVENSDAVIDVYDTEQICKATQLPERSESHSQTVDDASIVVTVSTESNKII
ncbi:hypothetical protein HDV04_002138 [Boothiomyces sp. JEL0838]|nr:hypothetical protein HDV04_002138 [Boothiomyces sp. JEL0838]